MLGDLLAGLWTGASEVFQIAGPALISGAVMKHGIRKLPNNAIPAINGALGLGLALLTGADVATAAQAGVLTAVGGTGTHQLLKITTRKLLGGKLNGASKHVGPGDELSI